MTGQMYELVLKATGEVRDVDGNLVSAEPVEATFRVTEEELAALNIEEKS